MKKYQFKILTLIFIAILLASCQKVIDLELKSSTPAIVIQGNITNRPDPCVVKISKTVQFDETNSYPPVVNAIVTISDDAGNSELLDEAFEGTYIASTIRGNIGRTYTLTVETEGKKYVATSKMPKDVRIDSIYFSKSTFSDELRTNISFTDPLNTDNYYRIVQIINDTVVTGFNVGDDKFYKGSVINYSLTSTTPTGNQPLSKGDRIKIILESIDEGTYEYFRTADSFVGQTASPANPVSNISNGALGYFSAYSFNDAMIFVP